jgi:hypothetical protein
MNAIVTGDRVSKAIQRASTFFSFLIGLGVSVLLFHRNFLTWKVPALPLAEMVEKTVKIDGKCYKYRVEDASCETSSST